jgi:hypothetical protein
VLEGETAKGMPSRGKAEGTRYGRAEGESRA